MSGHILAISWGMPPRVYPRSLQVARTMAALSGQGWTADVITADPPLAKELSPVRDEALAERYAHAYALHQVRYRDGFSPRPVRAWRKLLGRPQQELDEWEYEGLLAARRLIARRMPDALVTFAQPWSDHIIGLRLKKIYQDLPWVAHWSDPWADNPYAGEEARRTALVQERAVVELADALVFVTQRTADLVMRKYPDAMRRKVHVVPHAFDPEQRPDQPLHPVPGRLEILHTGNLYGARVPFSLLCVLSRLQREGIDPMPSLRCIGGVAQAFIDAAYALNLHDIVRFAPPVSFSACLEAQKQADMLLVIDAPAAENVFLPSKLIDYLASGLPILAMSPANGATADVLNDVGGVIASPDDPEALLRILRGLSDAARKGCLSDFTPNPAKAARYEAGATAVSFVAALRTAIVNCDARKPAR